MKMRTISFLCLLITALFILQATAADNAKDRRGVLKTTGTPVRTNLNINNISTVFKDDGVSDIDAQEQNSGLVFPKGSGKTAVFQSGFLWGGIVAGEVRVGGSAYRSGLQCGHILSPGIPEDPDLPKNRIYRVRPDYATASLATEVKEQGLSEDGVRAQYAADWNEWPASEGAPYKDVDGNGVYNPAIDIPGFPGADQTVWFVANDLNSGNTTNLYGSNPIGIEMQVTIWAYSQQGALGNMFFKKYLLINKSNDAIDSMYVSQWSDIDLGNSTDDYAGCDTTLSLGYVYNANATDLTYNPLPPPAMGFDFFQGPVVNSPGSHAIFRGQVVADKKNLPMTAFYYFARGDATVTDPTQGSYEGTTQFYNFFQGRIGKTGNVFVDPNTGQQTTFALAGDPQTRKGWVDGQVLPSGDRRIGLASGPFTMAPGDTQEVVVAELAAGAIVGTDRLSAIGLLKFYDLQAQLAYDNFFDLPIPPPPPSVKVTELDRELLLSWDTDRNAVDATEGSSAKGYAFQGYNVYQLPNGSATIDQAKRIATYDLVDGIGKIEDKVFDPSTGVVAVKVRQFGNDEGIKRYIDIKNDEIKGGTPLINGIRYYFAVTAYSYNPDPAAVPNNLENPLTIFTIVPHSIDPGVRYATPTQAAVPVEHPTGIANATVQANVVDPTKLLGSQYTVGWSTQPDKFSAAYVAPDPILTTGEVLMASSFVLNEAASEIVYNVRITNVDSLTGIITDAGIYNGPADGSGPLAKPLTFVVSTQLGKQVGIAQGVWKATDTVNALTPALVAELIAGNIYVGVNTASNPTGEIRAQFGILSYPWYLDRGTTRLLSYQQNYSLDNAYLVADGLQVKVGNLTFAAPFTYFSASQTVDVNPNDNPIALFGDGYDVFGNATGKASDNYGGGGSAVLEDFVQDLEFRFTGVPDPSYANPLEAPIISGGSIATVRSRSVGSAVARVRIPFELWEVERNRQINVVITDRNADAASPWGDSGTPLWYRIRGRDYIVPIATPYDASTDPAAILLITDPMSTWFVFFDGGENGTESTWDTGDNFVIVYANPIVPGLDTYTITAPAAPGYSTADAKKDIAKINVFPNPYYGVNTEELNKYQRFVTFSHLPEKATIRIFNLAGVLVRTLEKSAPGQFQRWDLANESALPVASGLYIAYIDMPDVGETKIIKLSVIQERQILDRF